MNVVIKDPKTEPGMVSDILLRYQCYFLKEDEGYGKKTYLSIVGEGKEKEYLEYWAHNYWTGKNGA